METKDVENAESGAVERATFIVRLSKAGRAAWHGVVELVGDDRRRHVASAAELAKFIDDSFAERREAEEGESYA